MTEPAEITGLIEREAIARLKYAYVRCVDTKNFDELRTLFTDDATAEYGGGAKEIAGADEIIAWLTDVLSDHGVLTTHRVTQPEIELVSATEARASWSLADTLIDTRFDITVTGASFYEDRYVKVDGRWLIAHTGYRRLFEQLEPRASTEGLTITASWFGTGGRSSLV